MKKRFTLNYLHFQFNPFAPSVKNIKIINILAFKASSIKKT